MSKYNVGDKFVVEINYKSEKGLYRIKGINTLVNNNNLDKLQKYDEVKERLELIDELKQVEYNRGLQDAWELAKKVALSPDMVKNAQIFIARNICAIDQKAFLKGFFNLTPQKALVMLEAYEKSRNENKIEVGDVVEICGKPVVVTRVSEDKAVIDGFGMGGFAKSYRYCECKKTGRHIDISSILEQIMQL